MLAATIQSTPIGAWIVGGGGIAIAGSLFKLAINVGKMTQLLEDHDARLRRLENINDVRHQGPRS
jgi:hypothetical protein